MPRICLDDRLLAEAGSFTHTGPRRRRRPSLETQPARCPLCDSVMVAYIAVGGPRFRCACDEVPVKETDEER